MYISKYEDKIILPDKIYAVAGCETNIYFDSLFLYNPERCYIQVECPIGTHQNERWTCIPDAEGSYEWTLRSFDRHGSVMEEVKTQILVAAKNSNKDKCVRFALVGDSIVESGFITRELLKLFSDDVMNIRLVGTKGQYPNLSEGYGGKTFEWIYSSEESPFLFDNRFNFGKYISENKFDGVDFVIFHLGVNDIFYSQNDIQAEDISGKAFCYMEKMAKNIWEFDRNIKVGLTMATPPSKNQDAFGASYGCQQTQWRHKRNIHIYSAIMIEKFSNKENQKFFLIPTHVNLDTEHNMKPGISRTNSRNDTLITRQSDSVHPSEKGYYQMADMLYYSLKNI